jgi:glycerol uptake facilitator protein
LLPSKVKFRRQVSNLAPIVIGLIVVAIDISFGGMNGYAINPARDLGPRIFAVIAGFKNND